MFPFNIREEEGESISPAEMCTVMRPAEGKAGVIGMKRELLHFSNIGHWPSEVNKYTLSHTVNFDLTHF